MKKSKILSTALAAGLAFGSLSAVSCAEGAETRAVSGYSITLENATVAGKEMAAVIFEGLPQEVFSFDYVHTDEEVLGQQNGQDIIWISDFSNCNTIVHIDYGESQDIKMRSYSYDDNNWKAWSINDDYERTDYQITAEKQGNGTITVTTYIDLNDKYLRSLAGKEEWTVSVCVELLGYGHSALATGDAYEYVEIIPGKKIELHTLDNLYDTPTQTIKVINNLTDVDPIIEKVFSDAEIEAAEGISEDVKTALSGITVTDSLGAFDADVVMNVKGVSQTEHSFSYDITFTKDGTEVQPRSTVTVKVPIPEFLKKCTIVVRHFNEDGTVHTLNSKIEDGFVIYSADHFSVYELSDSNAQPTKPKDPDSGSGSGSSSKTNSAETSATVASATNPNTGVSLAVAPAILAAGVVVVALNNKKRR